MGGERDQGQEKAEEKRNRRAFEYGLVGQSGRPRMGARPGAHDDTVMGLALAVFAAPESAPVPLGSQVLLGSSAGGMRRG